MNTRLRRCGKLAGGFGLLLALVLVITGAIPVFASSPPPPPAQYYGTVNYCNQTTVPAGTIVYAKINGATFGSGSVDSQGRYGYDTQNLFYVASDNPETPEKEGGVSGDTVQFYVLDQLTGQAPWISLTPQQVNLSLPQSPLTVNVSPAAGGTATGSGSYNCGTSVPVAATAASGYHFVNWTGPVGDANAASTTVTVNGPTTVTANFAQNPAQTYTLTTTASGGTVTAPGMGTFTYGAGTVVTLTVTPDSCKQFTAWTGDTSTIANTANASTTITMNGNYSVAATFATIQYTLTVSAGTGGTASGSGSFPCGTTQAISATATSGWHFVNWTGSGITDVNSASTTVSIDATKTVTANFAQNTVTLTTASGTGGTVSAPGVGTYTYNIGTVVNLVATTQDGCTQFKNWTGDVGSVANVNSASTTITMNGNYSITANWEKKQYVLTVNAGTGGTATGSGTFDCGSSKPISATAQSGFHFKNWTGSGITDVNSASTSVLIDAAKTVTANFEQDTPTSYTLRVICAPGGSVSAPGVGTFTYEPGATVTLTAAAQPGATFFRWMTGDAAAFADMNAASTTITMNGNYTITATFNVWNAQLCAGWNTFSVPVNPNSVCDTWGEFVTFTGLAIDPVSVTYYYDGSTQLWGQVLASYQLKACDALYVKMAQAQTVPILPATTLSVSSKTLYPNWNLVSLAALQEMGVKEGLISAFLVTGDKTGYAQVVSPQNCQTAWVYTRGAPDDPNMTPGKGYWVFMINGGTMGGFTFTPW